MAIKNFIEKLQNLPEEKKKAITWVIVAVLSLFMGFFWMKTAINRLDRLGDTAEQEIDILDTKK